ncbi:dynein regulatory complex protein 10 isoform X2 [Hydra vulgaris]|uniref:Dynein regulatory complex protein 10 n=1 Tax=Hydra vulgaris TaxID=6087 RepID=A0ABM4CE19_HYDVU
MTAAASYVQKDFKDKLGNNFLQAGFLIKDNKNKPSFSNSAQLDFSKKKLPSLDTQRVLSVIENFIFQLEVVTLIPFVIDNLDRFSAVFGDALNGSLLEYSRLQLLYNKLLSNTDKSASANSVERETFNSSFVIKDTASKVSDVLKRILTLFRSNPTATLVVKNNYKERSNEANNLILSVASIKDHLNIRLKTQMSEDVEQKVVTLNLIVRGHQCHAMIHKLEIEYNIAKKLKDDLIKQVNDRIDQLNIQIQNVQNESDAIKNAILLDAQNIHFVNVQEANTTQSKLQEDIAQIKQQLQSNLKAHRESELFLRKRKYKIETEVENWIQKYDSDMTERQEEYDKLSNEYAEEKKQLQDLEERFSIVKLQYDSIMHKRHLIEEHRIETEIKLRTMVKAAILIQAFWKGYRCRKLLKAKNKKTKKKKRKGKQKGLKKIK